jgi:hypothetical protein
MKCCGNCEYIKTTKSLLGNDILPIGTCRVQPPQYVGMRNAWLYPEVEIGTQACINYKLKGE